MKKDKSIKMKNEERYAGMPLNQQAMLGLIETNIENNYKKHQQHKPYEEFMEEINSIASNPNPEIFSNLYGQAHFDSNIRLYGINRREIFLQQKDINIKIVALSLARAKTHHNTELAWPYIARAFFSMGRLQQITEYEQMIQGEASTAQKSPHPTKNYKPLSHKARRQAIILKVFSAHAPEKKWPNLPIAVAAVHSQLQNEFKTQRNLVEGKDLSKITWFIKNIHKWNHEDPSFASGMSRFVSSLGSRKNTIL